MVSPGDLETRLRALLALFHQQSLDIPAGGIDRRAVFRLNDLAYHETMGRSTDDPIVRLVALGPAAYRFLSQGIHRALDEARVDIDGLEWIPRNDGWRAACHARLAGTLRGTGEPFYVVCPTTIDFDTNGGIVDVSVRMAEAEVSRLRAARGA